MSFRKTAVTASFLFVSLWVFLAPGRLSVPPSDTFSHDPGDYTSAAVHLVKESMYSTDGTHPFFEREPGYSVFLAAVYRIFGLENRLGIFLMQGILTLLAILLFTSELRRHVVGERIASTVLIFFVLLPSVYHTVFSAYRENFALILVLFFAASFLRLQRSPSVSAATLSGVLLGALLLTYIPFLFFPIFLIPLAWVLPIPKRHLLAVILIPYVFIVLWSGRNFLQEGGFRIAAPERTAIMIYVRGEQAEHIRGLEPFRCLFAEYISRNWEGRSAQCSFNGVMHGLVDSGRMSTETPAMIAAGGKAKILQFFPYYLWFSMFEVIEFHLPYVNGWGFVYNALAALSMVMLYVGCLLALPSLRRREYAIFLLLIVYCTVIFSFTDATPRYLLPIIFCYAVIGAVGYDWIIDRIWERGQKARSR